MVPPSQPRHRPPNHVGHDDEATITGLTVRGCLPARLAGRLLAIGPGTPGSAFGASAGMVHSVQVHAGGAASYRSRWVITDTVAERRGVDPAPGPRNSGPDVIASHVVAFGGSILALGEGSLAYELSPDLETLRRVDLAGQARSLASIPRRDPVTGDLHLLAITSTGAQAHVVVAANALTRTSRTIAGAPGRISDLAVTHGHVVFLADRFIGVTTRDSGADVTWMATGLGGAPYPVHAYDKADSIVIHTLTPALERWTLHTGSGGIEREVLDPAPRRSAPTPEQTLGTVPRFLWTVGDGTADKHDLLTGSHVRHTFRPGQPSGLVIVADAARPLEADGGWLVGFVHHATSAGGRTEVVVLDAADLARPPLATIPLPRRVPQGLHSTWIPSTQDRPSAS